MGRKGGPKPRASSQKRKNGKAAANTQEPRYGELDIAAPNWLDEQARAEWNRVAGELVNQRVVTAMDRALLEGYCAHYSVWRRAIEEGRDKPANHPANCEARQQSALLMKIIAEFGLSPSSRTQILAGNGDMQPGMTSLEAFRQAKIDREAARGK